MKPIGQNTAETADQFGVNESSAAMHPVTDLPVKSFKDFAAISGFLMSIMNSVSRRLLKVIQWIRFNSTTFFQAILELNNRIKYFGISDDVTVTYRRRLALLNQINILHFLSNIIIPVVVFVSNDNYSVTSLLLSLAPSLVSVLVLTLNAYRKYNSALLAYFILYPFFTCLIYLGGMNLGMELYFIMYGILAVFFLNEIGQIIFSVSFSMISYFILTVVLKNYSFQLQTANPAFYFFNQFVAIIFIFYGLLLIKKENSDYQEHILAQNRDITEKAKLLEAQTAQLSALNSVKTRLFSIISHDLRAPVYALRDLFRNAEKKRVSPEQFTELIPDVVNDLNKTTELMESLLQWAKSQIKAETLEKRLINIRELVAEATDPLRLQIESKQIRLRTVMDDAVYAFADADTINIVLRNFISNAIKFTPNGGSIIIEARAKGPVSEISIHDTGIGISEENIKKIFKGEHYSTKGTNNEKGTGLGLMLCQDFIIKNGGTMSAHSEMGKGSSFSFTLPSGN
ncbi:MAG: hypothetical protein GC171_06855 [Terrimonas sp.]|nr:hypothetical protein [Terrimonas sp.]